MKKKTFVVQKKLFLGKQSISSLQAGGVHGGSAATGGGHCTVFGVTCIPAGNCEISAGASCPINNTCGNQSGCVVSAGATCLGTGTGCGGCV